VFEIRKERKIIVLNYFSVFLHFPLDKYLKLAGIQYTVVGNQSGFVDALSRKPNIAQLLIN
jgi:hypothetical protein